MEYEKYTCLTRTNSKQKGGQRRCSVSNCDSRDNGNVIFHKIPRRGRKVVIKKSDGTKLLCDIRKVWEDIVGIEEKITKKSSVCSAHFKVEDYQNASRKRLKPTAVPSLNLPEESSAFLTFQQRPPHCFDIVDFNQNSNNAIKNKNVPIVPLENRESEIPTIVLTDDDSNDSSTKLENSEVRIPSKCSVWNHQLFDMLFMHTSFEFETLAAASNIPVFK